MGVITATLSPTGSRMDTYARNVSTASATNGFLSYIRRTTTGSAST